MVKFCPECGLKLEKEFKFCPECGFNLENINIGNSSEVYAETKNSVICNNCGEENNSENIICAGCGIRLRDKTEVKEITDTKRPPEQKKSQSHPKKSSKQNKTPDKNQAQPNQKSLGRKELVIISGILLVGIFLILSFSGVFDAKKIPETTSGVSQVQGSGVDLNNIQKINELEARVKANPNDKESLLALAHLKNDSGLYEQAILNYQKYLKLQPDNADARVDMGVCYYNLGDFNTAISEMENALKYKPNHQIAFLNLGIVNLSAGNLEKSKEWLKKALDQNPNNEVGKRAKELLESHAK